MPSSDDDIIRNGTFWQWLGYTVVFGGTPGDGYTITGGTRIAGGIILVVLMALAFGAGVLVG